MHQFQVPLNNKTAFLQEALAKHTLLDYLLGAKGYEYICPYADVPTYPEEVFDSIVGLVNHSKDAAIWSDFAASLLKISADTTYSWFALYYVSVYMRHFKTNGGEPVPLGNILPKIAANIQGNKAVLSKDQRWMGRGFPNGLWDNATSMAAILNRDFGLDIQLK